jgi:hypothetical protein
MKGVNMLEFLPHQIRWQEKAGPTAALLDSLKVPLGASYFEARQIVDRTGTLCDNNISSALRYRRMIHRQIMRALVRDFSKIVNRPLKEQSK